MYAGFASSGLEVEAGYEKWVNKRVWLSVTVRTEEEEGKVHAEEKELEEAVAERSPLTAKEERSGFERQVRDE